MSAGLPSPLALAFFGTPEFALPTLQRLHAGRHRVAVVVSQPARRRGRGRRAQQTPTGAFAQSAGLPLLQPERVGEAACTAALEAHAPDLGVVVAFGQFLPRRVRALPRAGYCINGHASLLPRHRGAAPVVHALLAGDAETGVSVMRVEREMDAGPVALTRRVKIAATETGGSLSARLAALTAKAIACAVDKAARGALEFCEQDHARASFAPRLTREDARLDFRASTATLARRVRAFAPKPGAFTTLNGEVLRVLEATTEDSARAPATPGCVSYEGAALRVACADGWLLPTRIQRAGARVLDIATFLRGRPIHSGQTLGDAGAAL